MGRGGFEPPTHGFSVRCSEDVSPEKKDTCINPAEALTPQRTPKSPKLPKMDTSELSPDLAEIVQRWPQLPDAIRSVIVAIVKAS